MNKSKMTKEDVELDEGNTTPEIKKAYADLIKTPSGSSERKTAIRHYKSLRQNLAKEEVEQVDEISKAMAGRYVKKAAASIDLTAWRQGYKEAGAGNPSKQLEKKLSKRHKGIETAVKKLTKEDIDAVKKMNESYKTAFESALNEYGIKSPSELDESKRKEFFNHVDLEFKKGDN
jgi:type IV pilus biogenesis protein CpaD/CtpE